MISKRVFIEADNDNYGRLARYIAAADHVDEKCLLSWCEGMLGGTDYAEDVAEVRDVQERNTRAASKTYHLVVSFRPEDEARLTPKVFKAIEARFASALGYTDHQRHCGVHKNTANLHMHVAYNMIHPEKYTCHKEFRDFWIRDKVCRALEREFGLAVDQGIERSSIDQPRINEKARTVEAHSGQQSFESYAQSHREAVLSSLDTATSWQDLHAALAAHGMEIKPHGNGLTIRDRHDKRAAHAMKASALDRSLSRQKLVARFGPYQPPQDLDRIRELSRYTAAPLHRSPERGRLFVEYRAGIEARKTALQGVKEQENAALAAIRAEWVAKRRELERKNIAKRNLRRLLQLARKHEAEALAKTRLSFQEPRAVVRQEIPFTSWNGFLQHKSEQGDEVALAVLRSWHEVIDPENSEVGKDWKSHGREYAGQAAATLRHAQKERAVLENEGLSAKGKRRLQAIIRMEQVLIRMESSIANPAVEYRIDKTGAVIFTLPTGGTIRDTGREVRFSANDAEAETIAGHYALKKWGKAISISGNRILRVNSMERSNAVPG
ncbi:TraI/MobA(P) family conjugative relaxase [Desulfovibrio aminophilus]|uniref:TraI/MobA(P) family conjugative relaxase n=1 Tax=Desulfovibrio aminophilus TaxID=81425 RepID=UPI003395C7C8